LGPILFLFGSHFPTETHLFICKKHNTRRRLGFCNMGNSSSFPPGDQSPLANEVAAYKNTRSGRDALMEARGETKTYEDAIAELKESDAVKHAKCALLQTYLLKLQRELMESRLNEEVCSVFVLVVSKVLLFFQS
jgi:hypothetical protein